MPVKILSKAEFDDFVFEAQPANEPGWSKIAYDFGKPATLTLKGTWNADLNAVTLKALLTPFPFETPMRPDVQLDELLTQIEGFTTGDQVARFFFDQGVRGFQTESADCPFAKWIKVMTGKDYRVGSHFITPPGEPAVFVAALTPAARDFVNRFDRGCYPQLVQGHQRNVAGQCDCGGCARFKPVMFEAA